MFIPPQVIPLRVFLAHSFIDGAYLRAQGKGIGVPFPHPFSITHYIVRAIANMGGGGGATASVLNRRTSYYDADMAEELGNVTTPELQAYWDYVEVQNDTHLRFGEVRGRDKRQKGVDVLLAVEMLVGAVEHIFDVAILVTGDADFVPVVNEVRRRGVTVVVGGVSATTAKELQTAADRFIRLEEQDFYALRQGPFMYPAAN